MLSLRKAGITKESILAGRWVPQGLPRSVRRLGLFNQMSRDTWRNSPIQSRFRAVPMQVLRLIPAGQIESKMAGLLLCGLQTASLNLRAA